LITVTYDHEFAYPNDLDGQHYPRLTLRVSNPGDPTQALDIEAYLDSGAQRSLLNGWIAHTLGLDVLQGPKQTYESTAGNAVTGMLHRVQLEHADFGSLDMEVGFSSIPIRRNLLGRDFFNPVQIGFREHQLSFYITAAP
jgi:hypothetical protein